MFNKYGYNRKHEYASASDDKIIMMLIFEDNPLGVKYSRLMIWFIEDKEILDMTRLRENIM
jgi:hypothetical protein